MLLALCLILLVLFIAGGVAIHPLVFLGILLVALLFFGAGGFGGGPGVRRW